MPQQPQTKRSQLLRNILFGVAAWVLPIIPTLLATRIVIERLGKDQYGALSIFLGFISYFFTVAIGKVAAKYAAEFQASGEEDKVPLVISATLIVSTGAALVSMLAVAAAAGPIVDDVLQIRGQLRDDSVVAVYIACATVVMTAAAQTFLQLLQGLHRFDRYFILANFTGISFSIAGLVLASLGYGFVTILVCNLLLWTIAGVTGLLFAKQALPSYVFTFKIPRQIWFLVIRYAAGIVSYLIFGNLLLLFERGWIVRHFGTTALADYVVPMTLALYIHAFVASLVSSMFPTMNELLTRPETLRVLYYNATKLVLAIVALATVSAIICGRTFLSVWLGPAFSEVSSQLLVIQTVTFSILALNAVAWHVAEGFRYASLNALGTLGWMVIGIAAMLLLTPNWGTLGVGAGRLVGVLPFVPMIFLVEHRFLGGVDWRFWGGSLARITVCSLACGLMQYLSIAALRDSWAALVIAGLGGFAAFGVAALLTRFVSVSEIRRITEGRRGIASAG